MRMWKRAKNCKLHQSILSPFSVSKTKLLKGREVKKKKIMLQVTRKKVSSFIMFQSLVLSTNINFLVKLKTQRVIFSYFYAFHKRMS